MTNNIFTPPTPTPTPAPSFTPAVSISDITESFRDKDDRRTLLVFDENGVAPEYAKNVAAAFLLMEWRMLQEEKKVLRCYAVLLPHGGVHLAEVFYFRQGMGDFLTGEFLGTSHVFSVKLPANEYTPEFDEAISQAIWAQVSANAGV